MSFALSKQHERHLLLHAFAQDRAMLLRGIGWDTNAEANDFLLAFGAESVLHAEAGIEAFVQGFDSKSHWFGHLGYDLKHQLHGLASRNQDAVEFAETQFFSPLHILQKRGETFHWLKGGVSKEEIEAMECEATASRSITWNARMSKAEYMAAMKRLKEHIQRGDTYQVNFCQEFFAEDVSLEPVAVFEELFARMPNPYSSLYKLNHHVAMCLSPEGFLSKRGNELVSRPMKGTAPRSGSEEQDEAFREMLANSEKDRRENVMITDLVRNDLSHFAAKGSVVVDELCTVKTYPRVHQMISKVRCTLRDNVHPIESLLKAFPMGSMTGAPKHRSMQVIEELEVSKRGLYSGAIGHVSAGGDFDFNVVIRTLIYDLNHRYLSCHVGGGITALSQSEAEYEECMVKFEPLRQLLDTMIAEPDMKKHSAVQLPLQGA